MEVDLAGGWFKKTDEHFNGCAFSGTVGAEVAKYFTRPDRETDAVHNGNAAITLQEIAGFEHTRKHRHPSSLPGSGKATDEHIEESLGIDTHRDVRIWRTRSVAHGLSCGRVAARFNGDEVFPQLQQRSVNE